ncbi:23S rRNA (pseudouridine(1915)-N(3))-methyltransferase RlmH [Patescibacteria group bacterium]
MIIEITKNMINIDIIQVGKTKEKYIENSVQEYIKRLKPFARIKIITLKELSPSKSKPASQTIKQEGQKILKTIKENSFIITLDEGGNECTSKEFSKKISQITQNNKHITFIIGGAFGLDKEVKSKASLILSLSKMTFTHQMIRPFLLEQIYRAYTIIAGKAYHN